MRNVIRIGLLALAAILPIVSGCATPDAETGYEQGAGSDRDVAREVMDRLRIDSQTSKYNIAVSVEDGIVTLTGPVPDAGARMRAVGIAQGTSGVKGVIDNLTRF